jgi:hypothetical protein
VLLDDGSRQSAGKGRRKVNRLAILLRPALVLSGISVVSAQTPPAATYKNGAELMAVIRGKIAQTPDQGVAPIVNEGAYRINVVRRDKPGPAGAHSSGPAKGTEVHYIIDGAATVVTGGTVVRPAGAAGGRGGAGSSIQGGASQHVVKGDVLVIPPDTPHWYQAVEGSVTYLEVRFDVDKK